LTDSQNIIWKNIQSIGVQHSTATVAQKKSEIIEKLLNFSGANVFIIRRTYNGRWRHFW